MSDSPDDDRERIAGGEPAWGDVLPGTDEVQYYVPTDPGLSPALCRTVAKEGAFYVESYRGQGRWEVDSEPFTWLGSQPGDQLRCRELTPIDAARLMVRLDQATSSGDNLAAEFEATVREWSVLQQRFTTPGAHPSHGTTRANRLARRMGVLSAKLLDEPAFRRRVDVMLADPDPHVRSLAAMYALTWSPIRAEGVLVEIEAMPGLVSMGAHYTLKRYRDGQGAAVAAAAPDVEDVALTDLTPDQERLLDDVWQFHGATMNGGFLTAFETSGHLAARIRLALEEMGLVEVAATIAAGCKLFPGGLVPDDAAERSRLIEDDVVADRLEALGDEYTRLIPSDHLLESHMSRLATPTHRER